MAAFSLVASRSRSVLTAYSERSPSAMNVMRPRILSSVRARRVRRSAISAAAPWLCSMNLCAASLRVRRIFAGVDHVGADRAEDERARELLVDVRLVRVPPALVVVAAAVAARGPPAMTIAVAAGAAAQAPSERVVSRGRAGSGNALAMR